MKLRKCSAFLLATVVLPSWANAAEQHGARVLTTAALKQYVEQFNAEDRGMTVLVDGKKLASSKDLSQIIASLR